MRTNSIITLVAVAMVCMVGCGGSTTTTPHQRPSVGSLVRAPRFVSSTGNFPSSIHASRASSVTSSVSGTTSSSTAASPASTPAHPALPSHLVRIDMVDSADGWAIDGDNILFTRNGPTEWRNVTPTGVGEEFGAPFFLGVSAWLFSNSRCAVYSTNNGGVNWIVSPPLIAASSPSANLCAGPVQMSFATASDGYLAVGPEAMQTPVVALYRTTNGGKTWSLVPGTPPITSVFAAAPQLLLGVSPDAGTPASPPEGILWQSRNGGESWDIAPIPYPAQITASSLGTIPVQVDGMVTSAGSVIIAMNLGRTLWLEEVGPTGQWARIGPVLTMPASYGGVSVRFFSSTSDVVAFDVGNGAVFQTTEDGAAWDAVSTTPALVGAYATFVSPTAGWAIASGALFATSDRGETWTMLPYTITTQDTPVSASASSEEGCNC